jgi:heavy metal translocating P-type ATPase
MARSLKTTLHQNDLQCDLCGLSLPPRPPVTEWNDQEYKFCCSGCRQVFVILAESGLLEGDYKSSDIYQTSLKLGIIAQPTEKGKSKPKKKETIEESKPEFTEEQLKEAKELTLHVGGMWCSACSWLIDKVVGAEEGVVDTRVLFAADTAKIRYLPQRISAQSIKDSIKKLGYSPSERSEPTTEADKERSRLLLRMGIAIFIAVNMMMLNAVLYIGYFENVSAQVARLITFILWIFATPSVFWCGFSIHRKAYRSLAARAPTMELLLSLGILTAYFYSIYVLFQGSTHIYFDTSANLVALILVGKFFETAARQKATGSIHRLYQMMPKKVRLKTSRGERLVAIEQLQIGDIFIVKPGEKIPGDGIIVKGSTSVDESLLTGESKPISKKEGAKIVGSAMNLSGHIHVRVTQTGGETTLARIIKMVENALLGKSRIEKLVDRISRWFIPAVLLVCFSTFVFLFIQGVSLETSIMRALTVLVIACPCALGIATPLALMAGIGYAARNGILIKDGSIFQKAAKLSTIFFDKTGTITAAEFSMLRHVDLADDEAAQKDHSRYIGALEEAANHPIAKAITAYCEQQNIKLYEAGDVSFHDGMGVSGTVSGKQVFTGNRKLFQHFDIDLPSTLLQQGQLEQASGHTVVYYHITILDAFGFYVLGDRLKPGAWETVSRLKRDGFGLRLISGDSEPTVKAMASKVGIDDFSFELTPVEKIEQIKAAQVSGDLVAMVGDGINDAPSLAQSDIGIAIGSGTELAIESSDIILLSSDLYKVWDSLDVSRRTIRTIKQNLVWAFLYNTVGMLVAVLGYLNPLMAASAMLISSISVVANSLRLHAGPGEAGKKIREILFPWLEPK